MSDSFADLWNSSVPSKPAPQKLGTPSPQPTSRRPQNDVFSLLSSSSTPTSSRPITPSARPAATQKPVSTGGGDAFSSLLGGTLGSNGNGMANMTMAERARQAEAERQRKMNAPQPASTTPSAWAGLDSLASGPSATSLKDEWAFGSAAPAPAQKPTVLDAEDDWGLGLGSTSHNAIPAQPPKPQALWDQLDDFTSAKPSPPARYASPSADFDFGNRENEADDFDLLGDLGKPVSSKRPSPPPVRETAELPARRRPQQRSSSPPPHILGQLIEMGFSVPQSRAALAQVYNDGDWDVQAAIDSLLASTGGAEGSSRQPTPPTAPSPPPRRRPVDPDLRRGSPQPQRPSPPERTSSMQNDLLARTSEIGLSLFKNAERAWLQGKEKVQKVYEQQIIGGEEAAKAPSGRPKWWQEPEDAGPGPSAGRRRDDSQQLFKDDAAHKQDDGWGDPSAGRWDEEEQEPVPKARKVPPAPQPTTGDLFSDEAPKKPYRSPFRHASGRSPASAPATAVVVPPAATHPPRPHVPVSPSALQTSRAHAATAQEKVALGQYGEALSAYTRAVDALPEGHVLRVPLLSLRSVARLKEGDFRGVEQDVEDLEGICTFGGRSFGVETVVSEGVNIDMGAAILDGWKRRGEAREGREKWEEAGRDWERVAGAAWAKQADRDEAVRGAGRCRKMAAPAPAKAPPPKPKSAPARPAVVQSGEAVAKVRQATNAQEEEDLAKHQLKDVVDGKLMAWKGGKEANIRALLASLDTVLWPELGLQVSGMKDLVTPSQVKIRYVKAIAKLHPDKLNANNSTLEQRMVANGVFGVLNEAWNVHLNK
ncbi:hypothetical protein FB45DRAFT_824546 [Roridomyces roridus]|uniref:UBA domain-containing protein n=1 Tax=Roridomyces roridus TaxID=1738132 RepID=A0AAD7CBP0_9AGAR|nr:hypothetical protein FB45DRAFT_824546 [Roridomyces roridus]